MSASVPHRASLACLVALVAALLLGACSGDDDGPPSVEAISFEASGAFAVIGEELTLEGSGLFGDLEVTVGGVPTTVIDASGDTALVRVPPGSPVGSVWVVASRGFLESAPVAIEVRRLAYTANFTNLTLSVLTVDGTDVELVGEIPVDVPPGPFAIAFTPDGRRAVVACSIAFLPQSIVDTLAPGAPPGDSVAIVDAIFGEVIGVVATGVPSQPSQPTGVAISPDGATAYVTNYVPSTISMIDIESATLRQGLAVPRQPEEIAVSSDGTLLFVPSDAGTVSTIDTTIVSVLGTVETGGNDPSGVALSPDAQTGYATNSFVDPSFGEDGTLSVLDLADPASPRVVGTVAAGIGPTPYDVKVAPGGALGVVTNLNVIFEPLSIGPGSISLVDLAAIPPVVIATIPVGTAPIHVSITYDGSVALVPNGLSGTVSVVNLVAQTVAATVPLGIAIGPADVAVQP